MLVEGEATAGFCAAWAAQRRWAFKLDSTPLQAARSDPELALPPVPSALPGNPKPCMQWQWLVPKRDDPGTVHGSLVSSMLPAT